MPLHPSGREAAVATLPGLLGLPGTFCFWHLPELFLRLGGETPPLPGPLHQNGPCWQDPEGKDGFSQVVLPPELG